MTHRMHTPRTLAPAVVLSLSLISAVAPAQSRSDAELLIELAQKPSPIEQNLRHLTDEIGGRVPGTPAMDKAVAWGVAAFKAAGADSVHTEEFKMPASWAEGATEVRVSAIGTSPDPRAAAVGPAVEFKLRAVSIAWAPAWTAKHVPVVDVGQGSAAEFKKAGDISGKVVLVHTDVLKAWEDLFNEYMKAPPVIDQA